MHFTKKELTGQSLQRINENPNLTGARKVYSDKIVDIKASPILGSISSGLDAVKKKTMSHSIVADSSVATYHHAPSTTGQGSLARELMEMMGVYIVQRPEDYTLLTCDKNRAEIGNPYIIVEKDFDSLEAGVITIQDLFPDSNDPIFTLENPVITHKEYIEESEMITGNKVTQKDLSAIAAGVANLNISNTIPKENKYFQRAPRMLQPSPKIHIAPVVQTWSADNAQKLPDIYNPNMNTELSTLIMQEQMTNVNKNYGPYSKGINYRTKNMKTAGRQRFYTYK